MHLSIFRKAFDVVDRELLFCILEQNRINGAFLNVEKELYKHTVNTIRINGHYSAYFDSKNGVCQGDNLSPVLFCKFIDGLIRELKMKNMGVSMPNGRKICLLAYADDLVLLGNSEQELQKLLDSMGEWCKRWRVLINVHKTKVVHFHKKSVSECDTNFILGTETIEKVSSYKYLGVCINYCLDMEVTINVLAKAGSRALGQLIGKTKGNFDLGYKSYTKLFDSTVAPVIDYAVGAWAGAKSVNHCKKLDQIQNRSIRFYCGLPQSCPVSGMTGDMGWIPGVVQRDLEVLRIYNQFVKMSNDRLTHQVFEYDKLAELPNSWSLNAKANYGYH